MNTRHALRDIRAIRVLAATWFDSLTKEQQQDYKRLHPNSKYSSGNGSAKDYPEPGKDWSEHAKISDPTYHGRQGVYHHNRSTELQERINRDLHKIGLSTNGREANKEYQKRYRQHPLFDSLKKHTKWKHKHWDQAYDPNKVLSSVCDLNLLQLQIRSFKRIEASTKWYYS